MLKIKLTDGKLPVVSIYGEIDHHNSYSFRRVMDEALNKGRSMVIDLSDVAYIDSAGVGIICNAIKRQQSRDCQLGLVLVDDNIKYIINIVSLSRIDNMLIFDTLEEAIKTMDDNIFDATNVC